MMLKRATLALLITAAACDADDPSDAVDSGASPAADASSTPTADASSTPTADASSTPTADASSTPTDDRLFPLKVGRVWNYQVNTTYTGCTGTTIEVLSQRASDNAYEVTGACGTSFTKVSGDQVENYVAVYDAWERSLNEPVQDGHSWTTSNGSATYSYQYSDEGSVTTPAGTFSDCWRATQLVSYTSYSIYCRGVGLVRSQVIDLGGGGVSMLLTEGPLD